MKRLIIPSFLLIIIVLSSIPGCGKPYDLDVLEPNRIKTTTATAAAGTILLELTHPAGKSPKVFSRGWVFGAKCVVNPGTDAEKDYSKQVKWSGDAEFEPATGNETHPLFKKIGENIIALEAVVEGKTVRKEYKIITVDPKIYAHLSDLAKCENDSHGCEACPHNVIGPIMTGSTTVKAHNMPAARVGDTGVHSACCGPNTFIIVEGDNEVLIDGRPAARKGDATRHCGGMGYIISSDPTDLPTVIPSAPPETTPATASPTPSETKTYPLLQVTALAGTAGLEDYGGQIVAVYVKGGKPPYYYEFGGKEIFFSAENSGTGLQANTKKSNFLFNGEKYYVWVTVKDSLGRYASWEDDKGNVQTKFIFGYKKDDADKYREIYTEPDGLFSN